MEGVRVMKGSGFGYDQGTVGARRCVMVRAGQRDHRGVCHRGRAWMTSCFRAKAHRDRRADLGGTISVPPCRFLAAASLTAEGCDNAAGYAMNSNCLDPSMSPCPQEAAACVAQ